MLSWYGRGAGLQYLAVTSHPPSTWAAALGGSLVTVILVMALVVLAWTRRQQLRGWVGQERSRRGEGQGRVAYKTQQSSQPLTFEGDMEDVDIN